MMVFMAERKNQIPRLIEQRNMSVYKLARLMQMPWHNVNRIVEAPTIPDGTAYKTLRKAAEVLGVKIDDLETEE